MFQERCQNIKYKSVLITTLFILFYFASLYLQPGVNVGVGGHAPLPPRPWIEQSLVQEPVKDRLLQEVLVRTTGPGLVGDILTTSNLHLHHHYHLQHHNHYHLYHLHYPHHHYHHHQQWTQTNSI